MIDGLRLERRHGPDVREWLDLLAELRIRVFREWPYLYEGDFDYERRYLELYPAAPRSLAVMVFDGHQPVGATTALPLADEAPEIRQPFAAAGFDVDRIFYNAESVLLPAYRGQGLYRRFFAEREQHARSFATYDRIVHCAVQRPDDHPLRPADHVPLDAVWSHFGYAPRPDLVARFPWRDIGHAQETEKPLMFWLKTL